MLYYSMPALAAGFILDLMIGDPRWLYHPVCLIGNLIAFLEKILRKIFPKTDKGELAAGIVEVILVCLLSGGIPFLILHILYGISVWAGFALETFWCYQLLATKSLKTESMKVYDRLKNGTLDEARYAVSMIVGRDTQCRRYRSWIPGYHKPGRCCKSTEEPDLPERHLQMECNFSGST